MLLYAGIDEAGYGPMLGPLCLGAVVAEVADADPAEGPPDLWARLSEAICRSPADRRRRIAIADSKKLKGAAGATAHPLRHLERGVLSAAMLEHPCPGEDVELLTRLGVPFDEICRRAPWYRAAPTALPLATSPERAGIDSAKLRRALDRAGVRLFTPIVEVVDEISFNRGCERSGKAHVNFAGAMRLLERIWARHPEGHPRVVVDRLGGRTDYVQPLLRYFPGVDLTVLGQSERVSRYRLDRGGSLLTVSFEQESETRHLPTALASMTAKFVRELFMLRFNRGFATHRPEVKPTAGYVADARRWLEEMTPTLTRLGLPRESLVRVS
jgi:hypothetical protein